MCLPGLTPIFRYSPSLRLHPLSSQETATVIYGPYVRTLQQVVGETLFGRQLKITRIMISVLVPMYICSLSMLRLIPSGICPFFKVSIFQIRFAEISDAIIRQRDFGMYDGASGRDVRRI